MDSFSRSANQNAVTLDRNSVTARVAQDNAEVRARAERRLGEMMKEMPKSEGGRLSEKNRGSKNSGLRDQGIDKNLAEKGTQCGK
jgi:hypothetical protein